MRSPLTEYLNFDILIGRQDGGGYPLRVTSSPGGEPSGRFELPFDTDQLAAYVRELGDQRRAGARSTREATLSEDPTAAATTGDDKAVAARFGRALFDALLGGPLATSYRVSRDRAAREQRGLRIRLKIDAPEVAALPWELLYDEVENDFVALSRRTPLVRYLELDRPAEPVATSRPLRVLGMIALPNDIATLDADAERQRIDKELASSVSLGLVELSWVAGQTWRHLQRTIRERPWNIFHFVGHGSAEIDGGSVLLADEHGKSAPLGAEELGRLLASQPALGLVILNACEGAKGGCGDPMTSTAATLVKRGIPAVIAMQHEVSDAGAITLARDFYAALADGLPVDAAMSESRLASSLENPQSHEWATPVLYMRAPDGKLFDLTDVSAAKSAERKAPVDDEFPEIPGSSNRGWLLALGAIIAGLAAYVLFLILSSS